MGEGTVLDYRMDKQNKYQEYINVKFDTEPSFIQNNGAGNPCLVSPNNLERLDKSSLEEGYEISENGIVSGNEVVSNEGKIYGYEKSYGYRKVSGNGVVSGNGIISDFGEVSGYVYSPMTEIKLKSNYSDFEFELKSYIDKNIKENIEDHVIKTILKLLREGE